MTVEQTQKTNRPVVGGAPDETAGSEQRDAVSPFHSGEHAIQQRLGVRDEIEPWASKVVRPFLPEAHREFYRQLPFLVVAARDRDGRPWVALVTGEPGLARSTDPQMLSIDAPLLSGDALEGACRVGDDVGILGIDLHSRRRNRVNGRVVVREAEALVIGVEQSFGNCPQYITERRWRRESVVEPGPAPRRHRRLTMAMRNAIGAADTFFIASGHRGEGDNPAYGMDASHRGGEPGFVRVVDDRTLLFPDYAGNNHFNTLGNLMLDARAGLLFVDFERGRMLQLTGHAYVEWDHPDQDAFPGARRLVRFELDEAVEPVQPLSLRWESTGGTVRELRLVEKRRESDDVISFVFEARDGSALERFAAGQYLPVEIEIPGHDNPLLRTYSLSNAPHDRRYRITVKRESRGLASRHLHDRVDVGDILSARPPRGDFRLDATSERPVVFVSAGVGVTPMVSMLHELVSSGHPPPVTFVHSVRDGCHRPLAEEVERLAAVNPKIRVHYVYSRPRPDDLSIPRAVYGRLGRRLLDELLPDVEADYYLCGPSGFMASVHQHLEDRSVAAERIHAESFGPVS